jgi:hypothetical protein
MINYPNQPTDFSELVKSCVKYHFGILKQIFLLLLFMTVGKDIWHYVGGMPDNTIAQWGINIFITAWIIYFWGCSLVASKAYSLGQSSPLINTLKIGLQRLPRAIACVVILIILFAFFYWLAHLFSRYSVWLSFLVLFSLPMIYLLVLFYYAIPLVFLENASIFKGFQQSSSLVGIHQWLRGFGLYALTLIIWILVSPDTIHGHVLANYYLSAPFDLVIFCLFIPLLNALILMLLNDLRLRQ